MRIHPLLCHLLDVAAVTETLCLRFTRIKDLPPDLLVYLDALHDIGKADPFFQNKVPDLADCLRAAVDYLPPMTAITVKFRHEARSAEWMRSYLKAEWGWDGNTAKIMVVLHGHHGYFNRPLNADDDPRNPGVAEWKEIRTALAQRIRDVLEVGSNLPEPFCHAGATGILLSGLLVLADWIASNNRIYRYLDLPRNGADIDYLAAARAEAQLAVEKLGFTPVTPAPMNPKPAFQDLWPECKSLRPSQSALQTLLLENPPLPGLALIEAPMGEGKTEAAIFLAEYWRNIAGCSGAYLALPTGATSNQMFQRYADFLERYRPGIVPRLVHGMAWLIDEQTPEIEQAQLSEEERETQAYRREWFQPAKRALLAPEAVGTIDQVLLAALNAKFSFLRLFGLADKVLIIDEVHAYDAYMTTILCRLLSWCHALHIPVILLSATLSARQRHALIKAYLAETAITVPIADDECTPYPLLTFIAPAGEMRRVEVDYTHETPRHVQICLHSDKLTQPKAIAALAAKETANGGCACVLMNTVDEAQAVFAELQEIVPADIALLFHARFRAEARIAIETKIVSMFGKEGKRPERAILVATQVVEQSLDVDFDVMISALAPIDLLLQRSGRLWRHLRENRTTAITAPVLHILLPDGADFGGTGKVYRHAPLWHTIALLRNEPEFEFVLPQDFRPLIEGCYGKDPARNGIDPEMLAKEEANWEYATEKEAQQAALHLFAEPRMEEFIPNAHLPVEEDEDGKTTDYFHARTRLGDRTRQALVLHSANLLALACLSDPPSHTQLRRLFLQKANLPAYWFYDLVDKDGQPLSLTGPSWLHGHLLLPMTDGHWQARHKCGYVVTIIDDPLRGLLWSTNKPPR